MHAYSGVATVRADPRRKSHLLSPPPRLPPSLPFRLAFPASDSNPGSFARLHVLHYPVQDRGRLAEFDVSAETPALKAFEDPGRDVFVIEQYHEYPPSVKFRSQISVSYQSRSIVAATAA